jgi:hypothetical protein
MWIQTNQELETAIARLQKREPGVLARFIVSLAQDTGPIGEQVRTFIVGDDLAQTVEALQERIGGLRTPTEYAHRHALGKEIGESLGFIVESIETLVLPVDANAAFRLLVLVFEVDGLALENCGEHHYEVACAYERAAQVMTRAAKGMPEAEVAAKVGELVAGDGYGVRRPLKRVIGGASS